MAEVLVPALFVYPGFGVRVPAQRFAPMLSTGLAAARRCDDALLNRICEVVERDAFALAWLLRLAPPRIEPPLGDPALREAIVALTADGFEVTFHDLTQDVALPVALAAVKPTDVAAGGGALLGLGCHPHYRARRSRRRCARRCS